MNTLAISQDFSGTGWRKRTAGTGAVTIASGVASCVGVGDGVAVLDYYIPVQPGMRVEVDIFAQKASGTAALAFDQIDHNSSSWTQADNILLDGTDWQFYHLSATVPLKSAAKKFLRLTMGVPSALAGSAKFTLPVIRTTRGFGGPLTIAAGLISVASGTAALDAKVPSFGMAVERTDANTVTVTLDHQMPSSPEDVRPRIFLTGTTDNEEIPVASAVTEGATPTFLVKWSTGAAFADVSSGTWYAYARVEI